MREKVLVVAVKFEDQIGNIRTIPNWKAALHLGQIWLKGPLNNGKDQLLLNSMPVMESYEVDEQNHLFPSGSLTPTVIMEEMEWQNLKDFLPVEMPVSALPGVLDVLMPVKMVRVETQRSAYALKTSLAVWRSYIESAPLVRLQQLSFAFSADQQEVLVIGNPLPAIPGKGYWLNNKLLIPIGFDFNPPLIAELLLSCLDTETASFILFKEDGQRSTIPVDGFTAANRALVRQIS